MKLLLCKNCRDIIALKLSTRCCGCGDTKGRYVTLETALYAGEGVPLGISNSSFDTALAEQPKEGLGKNFTAFVIPEHCETFIKVDFDHSKLNF